jgi:hypothetical protein
MFFFIITKKDFVFKGLLTERAHSALENDDMTDVEFLFDDGKTLRAHSLIMAFGSAPIHSLLYGRIPVDKTKPVPIKSEDFEAFNTMKR